MVQWISCWGLSVSVFTPETTILEYHLLTVDVVTKSPPTESQPVLPCALRDAFEFEDLVATAMIIGVCTENREYVSIGIHQLWMASGQPPEQPLKAGCGPDNKPRRHDR